MLKVFSWPRCGRTAIGCGKPPPAPQDYPNRPDHRGGALRRRRPGRHRGAHRGGADERTARPADGDRERRRRRRHDRLGARRQGRAGRLHRAAVGQRRAGAVPQLYARPLYNPVTDFEHVALFNDSARVLIVRKDFPANNYAEFVAYTKANHKDAIRLGRHGLRLAHLRHPDRHGARRHGHARALPRRRSGDAGPDRGPPRLHARTDLHRDAADQGRHREGHRHVRPERAPGLENIPAAPELGLKGLDCGAWGGFSFPKGTPKAIVERLAKATSDAIDTPAVVERYKGIGVVVPAKDRRSPEYFTKFVQSEIERWGVPIKASGVKIE